MSKIITQDTTQQLLKDLRDLIAKEGNGRNCIGYQKLAVTNAAVLKLTIPQGVNGPAMSAEITVESAGSTVAAAAVRYTIDNATNPQTGAAGANVDGTPLGDFDTIEILGSTNLAAFRVIACDAANTKYLKIHYFA